MSASYLLKPAIFLIDTLVSLYVFALLLRFLLQWVEADFYNPISQFLVKLTHPPLRWLRRLIPSVGRIDTASLVLMLALQGIGGYVIFLLQGIAIQPAALVVWSINQIVELTFNIFIFAIVIRALLSWFGSLGHNPVNSLLYGLTEPVLIFCRRLLPSLSGVDLSPLIALIGLQVAKMIVLPPLQQLIMSLQ